MSYHAYDLDSSDSSDSILQKPQKKSKRNIQGYPNNQSHRNNTKTNDYSEEYENIQPQGNLKKSNKQKKPNLNEKTKRKNYDIQDSDEENDDDNDDSYNSQRNSMQNLTSQSKLRAFSYGKSHKNDPKFLNFDLSDNEDEHGNDNDHEYPIKNKKQKSSDSTTRSNTKYSNTIGGGENSLNYRSKDFNPQVKSKTKNVIRTNDFSNKKSPEKSYSKVQYHNYDSDDNSYDDHDDNDNKQKISNKTKKTNSRIAYDQTDSDNDSAKNSERKKIDKEQIKESSSYSFNENCDWSFPMNYVPDPDDMKQIIEDYHDKYSIDYLLKRIMNNPSYRSSNDE